MTSSGSWPSLADLPQSLASSRHSMTEGDILYDAPTSEAFGIPVVWGKWFCMHMGFLWKASSSTQYRMESSSTFPDSETFLSRQRHCVQGFLSTDYRSSAWPGLRTGGYVRIDLLGLNTLKQPLTWVRSHVLLTIESCFIRKSWTNCRYYHRYL